MSAWSNESWLCCGRGGAIWASGRLVLGPANVLHRNAAEGGANAAQGGGVYAVFATIEIDRTNFTANEARQPVDTKESMDLGGLFAEGGALFLFQQVLRL
jgi:hypothetical protein